MRKKVFVSGCFDMLHSGHIAFLENAATYGDVYVGLGSDQTLFELKGRRPVNDENERLYMMKAINCVKSAFISQGSGILDFSEEIKRLRPDIFVVNQDGNIPKKQKLCEEESIEYVILNRLPHEDLQIRSTTSQREIDQMPYRIDLAGGWLDQPFVSKHHQGSVITISIAPTLEFNERSGMSTSTRRKATELWGNRLPNDEPEKIAKILFCYDNQPGSSYISGSQDSIGIVYPGLARSFYDGDYWPTKIENNIDGTILDFIEKSLYLKPLGPRSSDYDVLDEINIDYKRAQNLAIAADKTWNSLLSKDIRELGTAIRESFEAQVSMFPNMLTSDIKKFINEHKDKALGYKLAGAGGGGYLVIVSETSIPDSVKIIARRPQD